MDNPGWEWQDDLDHRRWWEEYDRAKQARNQHRNRNRNHTAEEQQMRISDEFSGNYLKAVNLQGRKVKVMISGVTRQEIGQGEDKQFKPVVHFKDKDKALVLNKTNATAIAEVLGDETDDWPGNEIILYPARVPFGSRTVDAIRVEMPTQSTPAQPEPQQRPHQGVPEGEFDDDIPF